MNDSLDDKEGFKPTELDLERLKSMPVDGRVISENGQWSCLRYAANPNRARWREFTLCFINCAVIYECSCLDEVMANLNAREEERLRGFKNRKKKD